MCRRGAFEGVKVIAEKTCIDLNARTNSDNTALNIAAKNGHKQNVEYMVEKADLMRDEIMLFTEEENMHRQRLDVTVLGLENELPSKAARDYGWDEVAIYLEKKEKLHNHWANRNCTLKLWLRKDEELPNG